MSVVQSCSDTNDALDFFRAQGLFLKPIARLNISVQLPQLKKSGAKISNWEVMEKVKDMAKPFGFPVFKVSKSSLEFIRFEAEIENYGLMEQVLAKLDKKTIKLSGFQESLKVRAAESKPQFPTRYDWDTFFANNKDTNEMKPGERPDTIFIQNLPTSWFINTQDKSGISKDKPSEYVLKKVFATFGEIRAVDIPILDPYREKMKSNISGIQKFTFGQDVVFDAYIQFTEYIGFVKAMNSLKGMKLMFKDKYEEKAWVANIKVDFDRTKHLSETTIKQRLQERAKIAKIERDKEEAERREKELEERKNAILRRQKEAEERERERHESKLLEEKRKRRMEREEKRRQKRLGMKISSTGEESEDFFSKQIELEERKLLVAQRKLESIRLLDEIFERVKIVQSQKREKESQPIVKRIQTSHAAKLRAGEYMTYKEKDEKLLHDKLVSELKEKEQQKVKKSSDKIRSVRDKHVASYADSLESISDSSDMKEENESSAEELRLTSTDEEVDRERQRSVSRRKSSGKRKRVKKSKKSSKRSDSSPESDSEEVENKKKRDLDKQISLMKRISARENNRSPTPVNSKSSRGRPHRTNTDDEEYPSYIDRALEERQKRRAEAKLLKRLAEQQNEELYDKMMHPHLYGGSINSSYKRPKPKIHYEEIQNEMLEELRRSRELQESRYSRTDSDPYIRKRNPKSSDIRSRRHHDHNGHTSDHRSKERREHHNHAS